MTSKEGNIIALQIFNSLKKDLYMKKFNILIILSLISQLSHAFDFTTGIIIKKESDYFIKNQENELKIDTTDLILKSLPSLFDPTFVKQSNKQPYAFEFKGEKNQDSFKLFEVPTNIPGATTLKGMLLYDKNSQTYSINGVSAKFGYTKNISGYEFDEISKKYFIGKNLIIDGDYDSDGIFVMQALTPVDLFSATPAKSKIENAEHFILKEMPKNENSQKKMSFRTTVFEKKGQTVVPGDDALIVTMSGRQGDSFGSVNGHFVSGIAEVRQDLSLRGEVSNAYVTNTKDILSGDTSLTNYFSHLVQGQNVYRPTYTIIVYGIDKNKLKQFRDALEASHIQFRTNKLTITPQFNCTTETIKALKDAGVEGEYLQLVNSLVGVATYPLKLVKGMGETLQYALANDPSRYQPAPAFQSLVKAFLTDKVRKKLGVKRIDYVFYSQIPSLRPVGGMALASIWKVAKFKKLYEMYEVDEATKLTVEDLRVVLEENLKEIPYK
jgi:hypothetical protein